MTALDTNPQSSAQEMYRSGKLVTPESLLLDVAERIGRIREDRIAVQIHLSALLPQNRQDTHLRIAGRMFDPLVTGYRSQVFLLTNGDIVMVGRDIPDADIDNAVYRLRTLFSKDPITYSGLDANGRDPFATIYDLEIDYEDFLEECERLKAEVEAEKQNPKHGARATLGELTPDILDEMLTALEDVDISQVLKRQSAIRVVSSNTARVEFQEFFLSMNDLRKMIAPNTNIFSNRWLFQHLTLSIDKKVLVELTHPHFAVRPRSMSLNLNLETLETKEFEAFVASMKDGETLWIEVPMIDTFGDLEAFFAARDKMQAAGHKVVMDGLHPSTLQFADTKPFLTDAIKVTWTNELLHPLNPDAEDNPAQRVMDAGPQNIILTRCDSEESIKWGLTHGIMRFQGQLIDKMMGAVTLHGCADRNGCTVKQCIDRKGAVSRGGRQGCTNLQQLDTLQDIDPTKLPRLARAMKEG